MKKLLATLLAVLTFSTSAYAFEWGGIIKNTSAYNMPFQNQDADSFFQSNGIFLWTTFPFNKEGNINLKSELMYSYNLSIPSKTFTNIVDADLFKFSAGFDLQKGNLSVYAGRYAVSDISNVIFTQNSDGLYFSYENLAVSFNVYGGYTGLLNTKNVYILGSDGIPLSGSNDFYQPGANFIPLMATLGFPSLFANQTVTFQGSAFIDVRGALNPYNRYYGSILISGPLSGKMYYSLVSDWGSVNFNSLMNYSALKLSFYPTKIVTINMLMEYASGKNGFLSPFIGFTSRYAYSAAESVQTTGVLIPSMALSFSLCSNSLFIDLSSKCVMICPEDKINFKGVQGDLSITYNLMSDLQMACDLSGFICNPELGDSNKLNCAFRLSMSF